MKENHTETKYFTSAVFLLHYVVFLNWQNATNKAVKNPYKLTKPGIL